VCECFFTLYFFFCNRVPFFLSSLLLYSSFFHHFLAMFVFSFHHVVRSFLFWVFEKKQASQPAVKLLREENWSSIFQKDLSLSLSFSDCFRSVFVCVSGLGFRV